MIVVMKREATEEQIQHVIDLVREYGLKDHPIHGTDRTVIACIGDKRSVDKGAIENAPMVEKIMPILSPYKMASREVHQERSEIAIGAGGATLGGRKVGVIAGPCAVESREQLLETAYAVADAGAIALRGGAWKPRTSPYAFQGLHEKGLEILAEAREKTGLAIVTEVLSADTVDLVSQYADVLQIGARNMQHYPLLEAVGRVDKPVMLKRGPSSTMEEFLLAAEYIINGGNRDVIMCERGIRTFETYARNTLPLSIVPALHEETHLPVIVDPSHSTGHSHLVPPMCLAAVAAGADGLLVEVHRDPEHADTDAAQQISPHAFAAMMKRLRRIAEAVGREA